jgi:hypothetical protein
VTFTGSFISRPMVTTPPALKSSPASGLSTALTEGTAPADVGVKNTTGPGVKLGTHAEKISDVPATVPLVTQRFAAPSAPWPWNRTSLPNTTKLPGLSPSENAPATESSEVPAAVPFVIHSSLW